MPPDYSRRAVPCYRWPKSDNRRHDLGEILISLGPGEPLDPRPWIHFAATFAMRSYSRIMPERACSKRLAPVPQSQLCPLNGQWAFCGDGSGARAVCAAWIGRGFGKGLSAQIVGEAVQVPMGRPSETADQSRRAPARSQPSEAAANWDLPTPD